MKFMLNLVKSILVIALAIGLAGCAGTGIKPNGNADSQSDVAKKAQSRWDALIEGDLAKAYTYLSPGTRSVMSLDLYKSKIRLGLWKKAKVDSVSCMQDQCKVAITIEYSYRDMKSITTLLEETWLQDNGNWWYTPNK